MFTSCSLGVSWSFQWKFRLRLYQETPGASCVSSKNAPNPTLAVSSTRLLSLGRHPQSAGHQGAVSWALQGYTSKSWDPGPQKIGGKSMEKQRALIHPHFSELPEGHRETGTMPQPSVLIFSACFKSQGSQNSLGLEVDVRLWPQNKYLLVLKHGKSMIPTNWRCSIAMVNCWKVQLELLVDKTHGSNHQMLGYEVLKTL